MRIDIDKILAIVKDECATQEPYVFFSSVQQETFSRWIDNVNKHLAQLQALLAKTGEDTPEGLAANVKNPYHKSQAKRAAAQELVDSWKGAPQSIKNQVVQTAMDEIDQELERLISSGIAYLTTQKGIDLAKDVEFGSRWKLSETFTDEKKEEFLTHVSADEMQDLALSMCVGAIMEELRTRGYDLNGPDKFLFINVDSPQYIERFLSRHAIYFDARTPESKKEEIRQRAREHGVQLPDYKRVI